VIAEVRAHPTRPLLELAFDGTALYALRNTVAAHIRDVTETRTAESVVLIVHELCSNAVRHGGGTGQLRIWIADRALHCEVNDTGPGLTEPGLAGRELPSPLVPGGRGLWIARQMSELSITTGDTGTTITAVVAL